MAAYRCTEDAVRQEDGLFVAMMHHGAMETWMRFVVLPLARGRWIWIMRDGEGRTVCESATSFISRERAFSAIHEMRAKAQDAEIVELPDGAADSPN